MELFSPISLKQLIIESYQGPFNNRFFNAVRGTKHRVRLDTIVQWKLKDRKDLSSAEQRITYRFTVMSRQPDGTMHKHPFVLLMDYLSVDSPFKMRSGGLAKYTNKDTMDEKRIMGDFYFCFMWLYKKYGLLWGRDTTNGKPPIIKNPQQRLGMCKVSWSAVISLLESGFVGRGDRNDVDGNSKFIKSLGW